MKHRQRLSHLRKIGWLLRWSRMLPLGAALASPLRRLLGSYDSVRPDQHQKLRWSIDNEGLRHRVVADWLWRERQAVHAMARRTSPGTVPVEITETRPPQSS